MASQQFRDLEREIKRLRRELLPKAFDPTGLYPRSVQTRTRAFLILSHAAIEGYLEAEAKRIARRAETLWNNQGKISAPLAYLIGFSPEETRVLIPSPKRCPKLQLQDTVKKIFHEYYNLVGNNNGLKESNILPLFSKLGVEHAAYGSYLLPALNSLGKDRGDQAHLGAKLAVYLDPKSEWDRIGLVLKELEPFDSNLRAYLALVK